MGHVADIFTHERLARLPGDTAIGHVRYSTAGGSMLCNAQPIVASMGKGLIAVAHNGTVLYREDWAAIQLRDGDRLEIVRMIGGG